MPDCLLAPNNRLFELARQGRLRLPRVLGERGRTIIDRLYPIVALLVGALIPLLAGLLFVLPLLILIRMGVFTPTQPLALGGTDLGTTVALILNFGPIFLVLWAWLRLVERRPLWTTGMERQGLLWKYARGLLVGLAMFSAAVGLFALLGYAGFESGSLRLTGAAARSGVLMIFVGWMIQGAAEEILTRGFLLPVIGIRYGSIAGIVLSALLFAALHLLNDNVNLIAMLNLVLFGVFAALYALYEGGLWGVFAIHSVWNWAQGNLYGLQVSGQTLATSTLLDLQETGPDWLTGGAFGPEGGLSVTLVLLVASALVWIAYRVRASREVNTIR